MIAAYVPERYGRGIDVAALTSLPPSIKEFCSPHIRLAGFAKQSAPRKCIYSAITSGEDLALAIYGPATRQPQWKSHTIKKLMTSWPSNVAILVSIDKEYNHIPAHEFINELRKIGTHLERKLVPVINLNELQSAFQELPNLDEICVRVPYATLRRALRLGETELIAPLRKTSVKIIPIIDFGEFFEGHYFQIEAIEEDITRFVSLVEPERAIIAANSYPRRIPKTKKQLVRFRRYDFKLLDALSELKLGVTLSFSDETCVAPRFDEKLVGRSKYRPTARYFNFQHWIISVGTSADPAGRRKQYPNVCLNLIVATDDHTLIDSVGIRMYLASIKRAINLDTGLAMFAGINATVCLTVCRLQPGGWAAQSLLPVLPKPPSTPEAHQTELPLS